MYLCVLFIKELESDAQTIPTHVFHTVPRYSRMLQDTVRPWYKQAATSTWLKEG